MMKYKGYLGEVAYDADAKIFHGEALFYSSLQTCFYSHCPIGFHSEVQWQNDKFANFPEGFPKCTLAGDYLYLLMPLLFVSPCNGAWVHDIHESRPGSTCGRPSRSSKHATFVLAHWGPLAAGPGLQCRYSSCS